MKHTIAIVSICLHFCAVVSVFFVAPIASGDVASLAITNRFILTKETTNSIPISCFQPGSGAVVFRFRPTGTGDGKLLDFGGISIKYNEATNGICHFRVFWKGADGKEGQSYPFSSPRYPERWHRVVLSWASEKALIKCGIDGLGMDNLGITEIAAKLPADFIPKEMAFGGGICGIIESIALYTKEPPETDFVGIDASYDFENGNIPPMMICAYDALLSAQKGEGVFGSAGFLRVGPNTLLFIGARIHAAFTVTEDTWLGFSARKEGGGRVEVLFADKKKNVNVNANVGLPADGSWGTFRIEVSKLGMSVGTPVDGISFFLVNRAETLAVFDLDNICLGHGRPAEIPSAPAAVKAQTTNGMAVVTWRMLDSLCGLMEYRVYRGYHPDFARDERHLVGRIQKNIFTENTFANPATCYYAVRAVDFAGNESKDSGTVFINLSREK